MEIATFGAGCFWGVEETFRQVPGFVASAVGYAGGTLENPTYKDICTGQTGHAEVTQVSFDTDLTTFENLLKVFWECHDATQQNRQGPDIGTQYRSIILYHSPAQKAAAEASAMVLERTKQFAKPIVTEIIPAGIFYRAEDYHQQYIEKRHPVSLPVW